MSELRTEPRETIGMVPLPEEAMVSLVTNGQFLARMSCSPTELKELAVGWLFAQGVIESAAEIAEFWLEHGCGKIRVSLIEPFLDRFASLKFGQSSACGGGSFNSRLVTNLRPIERTYPLELARLKKIMQEMLPRETMYKVHGGVHCAMLAVCDTGEIVVAMEDIGRNNAIDKVIGWSLLHSVDLPNLVLFVTGRISSDMILKAYGARISTVVSMTTATTLAYEIVKKTGQTLICHVLKPKPILINF